MSQIGSVYAQALYSLAEEESLGETILDELKTINEIVSREEDFLRLLSASTLSKEERCSLLDQAFRGKTHIYVLNFMKLLTEKGKIVHFPQACAAFREQYNTDHGILPVRAVSAVALTPAQTKRLTEKLCAITGKTVELTNRIDPACLGGIRLDYDGKRVDGTVKNRLDGMAATLKNTQL